MDYRYLLCVVSIVNSVTAENPISRNYARMASVTNLLSTFEN